MSVLVSHLAWGTGVDITFDNNAQLIDVVYGFFQARVNTHFDIDQQLSRVSVTRKKSESGLHPKHSDSKRSPTSSSER